MLQDLTTYLPYIIGYVVATVGAQWLIWPIMNNMWKSVGSALADRPRYWHSTVLGMIERIMFVGSLQFKKPEFIGVWLAFKIASQWSRWINDGKTDQKKETAKVQGRELYNIFLTGNALSIVYSAVGASMIELLVAGKTLPALALAVVVLVGSGILSAYVQRKAKQSKDYVE